MTVADARQISVADACRTGVYIGGVWRQAASDHTFEVRDPATDTCIATLADAGPPEALHALTAACEAQTNWSQVAPRVRADILRAAFEALLVRRLEVATTITLEMGKSLAESHTEVTYAAEFLRWFSEEAVRIDGRWGSFPEGHGHMHVSRRPVGPCYLATPWNFPLAMITRKVAPALAAGCTVVLKPADLTPLSAILMVDILEKAGLPPGVVNLVTTTQPAPISETLLTDARLRKLSFTGSTPVGRQLLNLASQRILRCSMELGGNAPFVVLEGADVTAAIDGAMTAKFRNIGQACTAANRFLVHETLADDFATGLADRVNALRVGPGLETDTDLGPLISHPAAQRAERIVTDALGKGARLLAGGRRVDRPGHFFEPTVLADVPDHALAMTEEVFAPIAPIATFADPDDALRRANASEFGLASYVYAPSHDTGRAFASQLEAGMVGVNTGILSNAAAPFGGMKSSGIGREGGTEGIDEYLSIQYSATPRLT